MVPKLYHVWIERYKKPNSMVYQKTISYIYFLLKFPGLYTSKSCRRTTAQLWFPLDPKQLGCSTNCPQTYKFQCTCRFSQSRGYFIRYGQLKSCLQSIRYNCLGELYPGHGAWPPSSIIIINNDIVMRKESQPQEQK